jgi:predicted DNA-binding transcriptional regulator AlpA
VNGHESLGGGQRGNSLERLLPERDAAAILGVSVYWLQRQRWLGTGPSFVRVGGPNGRAVRYRASDLEQWIESNLVDPKRTSFNADKE